MRIGAEDILFIKGFRRRHLFFIRETKATTTGGAAATRARVAASKAPAKAAAVVELSLRSRLRNKGELRRAFVVNEILSQPLSQR